MKFGTPPNLISLLSGPNPIQTRESPNKLFRQWACLYHFEVKDKVHNLPRVASYPKLIKSYFITKYLISGSTCKSSKRNARPKAPLSQPPEEIPKKEKDSRTTEIPNFSKMQPSFLCRPRKTLSGVLNLTLRLCMNVPQVHTHFLPQTKNHRDLPDRQRLCRTPLAY